MSGLKDWGVVGREVLVWEIRVTQESFVDGRVGRGIVEVPFVEGQYRYWFPRGIEV